MKRTSATDAPLIGELVRQGFREAALAGVARAEAAGVEPAKASAQHEDLSPALAEYEEKRHARA